MKLKKVAIVKDVLAPLVDHVNLSECSDIVQLKSLLKYIEMNTRMLITGQVKLKKFAETLSKRLDVLSNDLLQEPPLDGMIMIMQDDNLDMPPAHNVTEK